MADHQQSHSGETAVSETLRSAGTGVRVATAAVLLPLVVGAVWWGPPWLVAFLVAAVTVVSLEEFFTLGARQGLQGYRLWTAACAVGVIASQLSAGGTRAYHLGRDLLLLNEPQVPLDFILLAFVFGLAAAVVLGRRALVDALGSLGMSAAGLLLIALPLSYIVRLRGLQDGPTWLLFTLALIWVGDTAAYFTGRAIGRLPMAAQISPKKTWEGAAGNLLGSLVVAGVFSRWLGVGAVHLIAMAVLANIAGQLGDLAESACKRGAGVKDSGSLLPGHGGMLDRIDALIFAAPVVWAYVSFLH